MIFKKFIDIQYMKFYFFKYNEILSIKNNMLLTLLLINNIFYQFNKFIYI